MQSRPPYAVWAPRAERVRMAVSDKSGPRVVPMQRTEDDWWVPAETVERGLDYGYLLDDDETPLPDPRSRRQPAGVHGLSRDCDLTTFGWSDGSWTGRQLAGGLVYEAHVGTFTPEGTLDAMIERLPHLRDLGVTHLELLPVNSFNGPWNWGYDGVDWWAVHEAYGGPEAYQRLVDAAHAQGLAIVQDVVYNHLGPSGNYLPRFAPYLVDGRSNTWGQSVNLDGEHSAGVREMIIGNALMWLDEMHVDALRLDAVHALHDESPRHLLEELAVEVGALSAHLGRPLTLIAESDLNDPRMIAPREAGGLGVDAQWSDDFHHAVHANLTGESSGYYADFANLDALVKVLDKGFFHDGTYSSFRGRVHGRPIDTEVVDAWRLVVCVQNHDQIGNRARGDRLTESLSADQLACAALLLLTAPFTPMLFQGEEWAASSPFQFFTSHPEPELGEVTARGRLEEFEKMGWDADQVPDPQDDQTFYRSKLDWNELALGDHARLLEIYRALARLRRERPELTRPDFGHAHLEGRVVVLDRGDLRIAVNLGDEPAEIDGVEDVLLATSQTCTTDQLPGWSGVVGVRASGRPTPEPKE